MIGYKITFKDKDFTSGSFENISWRQGKIRSGFQPF